QGRHVEAERIAPVGQEGLDLGAEEEFPRGGVEVVVQRLDPERVPRGEQAAASRVPEREREHALEPRDARLPPFRVRAEDHLRVGGRGAKTLRARAALRSPFAPVPSLLPYNGPAAGSQTSSGTLCTNPRADRRLPAMAC